MEKDPDETKILFMIRNMQKLSKVYGWKWKNGFPDIRMKKNDARKFDVKEGASRSSAGRKMPLIQKSNFILSVERHLLCRYCTEVIP